MIKRYLDFINESLELLLESNVVYSNNFKKVMSKIEHPLAKTILDIENQDLPVRNNYLDVNLKENDKLGFIPDRKAQEILGDTKVYVNFVGTGGGWLRNKEVNRSLFDKLGYTYEEGTEPYNAPSTEVGEVISETISETSGKKYAWVKFPNGQGVYNAEKLRIVDNKEKALWSKGRQEIFVGRGIRALLTSAGIKFLDKDLEEFVNLYKATLDKMNDRFQYFESVKGEDIGHWYHYGTYYERQGSLGSSCMSNVNKNYFDIYMSNPDVCELVILKSEEDDSLIVGRALLWTLSDGKKFMDRIYTIKDSDVQLFRDWAKENGWYSKQYNSSTDSGRAIAPDGENVDLGTITVDIKRGMYEAYPYLDTLKHFKPREGTLSNRRTGGDEYLLEDTNGELYRCEYCNGSGNQTCGDCDGDGSWECQRCHGDGKIECDSCGGDGKEECSKCDGIGHIGEGEDAEDCDLCDGTGQVDCSDCDSTGKEDCPSCDGEGSEECENCNGRGEHSCYECQ
jgi:hypothetical protein